MPVRTELVTRGELAPQHPRTLADAVEFITGVRVENNCQNCNFSQIRLLGLEGAYSQILVDGQPLVSSLAAVYAIEQIPASLIERIEVVKGGGSALSGSGSIGGVVNMIPHTPRANALHARFAVESMTGANVSSKSPDIGFSAGLQADFAWNDRREALVLWVQRDRELPVDLTGDGFTEIGYKELFGGGLRYTRAFERMDATLTADLSHTFEDRRGGNILDRPEHEADIAESVEPTSDALAFAWNHAVSPVFDYRIAAAWSRTERDSYYGAGRDSHSRLTTRSYRIRSASK